MDFYYETRHFKLNDGKVVCLRYFPENFIASARRESIEIGNLFYEFSHPERECIVHHELFHQTQAPWESWIARINQSYSHSLEFNADYHSAQKTSRNNTISALERLRIMVEAGMLPPNHEKTHPPIEERILRIKSI